MRIAPALIALAAAAAAGCRGRGGMSGEPRPGSGHDGGAATARDGGAATATADIPADRTCGEAGATATALPASLGAGMQVNGDGTVHAGDKATIGGVQASYRLDAWIGTMENGYRGAALELEIDRAEVDEHTPWGDQIELQPGLKRQTFIGPYRIDVTASGEEPPARIDIHVERRGCPDYQVVAPRPLPIWMWASTEAIRLFTIDMDAMLQVDVSGGPGEPRIEVRTLGWSQTFAPVPGVVRSARSDGRIVTIEAVEPGRGSRYDGAAWHADGETVRFSARVRVEAAPAVAIAAADTDAAACGPPSPSRTRLPAELAVAPRKGAVVTIADGQKRTVGGVELTATHGEIPAGPGPYGRKAEPYLTLSSPATSPSSMTFSGGYPPGPARAEKSLLLFDPVGSGAPPAAVRVRSFPLACPRTLALPVPDAPVTLWLSTIGRGYVTFGAADRPALVLELSADARDASFMATTPDARDIRTVGADLAGHIVTLDDLTLQITDVVIDPGRSPFPIVHVQVRITRG